MREWDFRSSHQVDHFIANSAFVARRIEKCYRRQAQVIYPPVDLENFALCKAKEKYYLTVSRLVSYKKVDLIVRAFRELQNKQLIVIGEGPELSSLKKMATSNISFLGYQTVEKLQYYLQRAKGFIFAALEDFGIAPLEALACGTPVIAYGKGGALETVRGLEDKHPTGLFFDSQTVIGIKEAIETFEKNISKFDPERCRERALAFSRERFHNAFTSFVEEKRKEY